MNRLGALGAAASVGAILVVAPVALAASRGPEAAQVEIARLVIATPVRARPTTQSALRGRIAATRPLTHQQTSLPVVRRAEDRSGAGWLLVPLPGRPSGRVGWIPEANTVVSRSPWSVVVNRTARTTSVYRNGRLFQWFAVVVGTRATPTPAGRYFVEEHVRQEAGSVLGPWALATNAYSHVLQEFNGGQGQVALHGRAGSLLADPLGTARSYGCIRFDNDAIRRLAALLPNGTPIEIV